MALTLAHLAKIEKNPLKAYVMMNLLREIDVMNLIPWNPASSLRVAGLRWRNLPDVAFRSLNEGYTASEGDVEQVWESMYGFGGDIQFDRVFEYLTDVVVNPKKLQSDMKLKSMSLKFNDYWINGDPGVDPKGFSGLKYRVAQMPTRQTVYCASAASAALDPTASTANATAFLNRLEDLHKVTNAGEHQAFFANEGITWGIGRVLRYISISGGNILSITKDQFDRRVVNLWGSPVYDMGLKKDQSTEIITETETAGDAGADATSIYTAAFNEEQGIIGAQLNSLDIYDPLGGGEMESAPARKLRIDWWIGLVGMGSYGIARGRNLEGAANWT